MTKPLGITIEASSDKAALVYITSVGEQVSIHLRYAGLRHKEHACLLSHVCNVQCETMTNGKWLRSLRSTRIVLAS